MLELGKKIDRWMGSGYMHIIINPLIRCCIKERQGKAAIYHLQVAWSEAPKGHGQ